MAFIWLRRSYNAINDNVSFVDICIGGMVATDYFNQWIEADLVLRLGMMWFFVCLS